MSFLTIAEGGLQREKGAIVAMAVNPATDNVNLVNLGFTDDIGRITQRGSQGQKVVDSVLHSPCLMLNACLLNQAAMAYEIEFVMIFFGGGIDDEEGIGLNRPCDYTLSNQ